MIGFLEAALALVLATTEDPSPFPLNALSRDPEAARTFDYWRLRDGRDPAELAALGRSVTRNTRAGACPTDAEREVVTGLATAANAETEARWRADREAGATAIARYQAARTRILAGRKSDFPGLDAAMADDLADWRAARSPRIAALFRQVVIDQLPMKALMVAVEEGSVSDGAFAYLNDTLVQEECLNSRAQTAWLKAEVARHGWYLRSHDGKAAAEAAWVIVQHADHDVAFQKSILAQLEKLLSSGDLDRSHYAFLWDRIAVNEGRPQRYGTQLKGCVEGKAAPAPIEEPEGVDARRVALGMEPLEVYVGVWSKAQHCHA